MKQYYPTIFLKETDDQYFISFPDLPEAYVRTPIKMAKNSIC